MHPEKPEIHSLYPNPFNPTVTVDFDVAAAGDVSVDVYDVAGRKLRTISRGYRGQGRHQARWDARSDQGTQVASGVYWLVVTSENGRAQRKMTLLK